MPIGKRRSRKASMISVAFCSFAIVAAGAQRSRGQQASDQERTAAVRMSKRFCQAELQKIPDDVLSITGCLQANHGKISRVYRNALARNGNPTVALDDLSSRRGLCRPTAGAVRQRCR
jgi:hypothetical protein